MAPPWKILQVNQEIMVGTIQQIGQTISSLNDAVTAANSNAVAVTTDLASIAARLNVWKAAVAAGSYDTNQVVTFDRSTVSTAGTIWTLSDDAKEVVCSAGGHYDFTVANVGPGTLYLYRNGDSINFLPVDVDVSAGDRMHVVTYPDPQTFAPATAMLTIQ